MKLKWKRTFSLLESFNNKILHDASFCKTNTCIIFNINENVFVILNMVFYSKQNIHFMITIHCIFHLNSINTFSFSSNNIFINIKYQNKLTVFQSCHVSYSKTEKERIK